MTELGPVLARLGLSQYTEAFIDEGFDSWETVLDITESDLYEKPFYRPPSAPLILRPRDVLNVKLGHRRVRHSLQPASSNRARACAHAVLAFKGLTKLASASDFKEKSPTFAVLLLSIWCHHPPERFQLKDRIMKMSMGIN